MTEPYDERYLIVMHDEEIADEYVAGEYLSLDAARTAFRLKIEEEGIDEKPDTWSIRIVSISETTGDYLGVEAFERGRATRKPRIYIAGPMTGILDMNAPRFYEAERALSCAGWDVVNPARMDADAGIDTDNKTELTPEEYMQAAKRDLLAIEECDAVYFLDEYETSPGAKWEWAFAKTRGLAMFYQTPKPIALEGRQS